MLGPYTLQISVGGYSSLCPFEGKPFGRPLGSYGKIKFPEILAILVVPVLFRPTQNTFGLRLYRYR